MDADKSNAQQPIQHRLIGSWALPVIDYFDSKARLSSTAGTRESVFRTTLKDFEKDKQWLGQSKIKAY